MDISGLFTKWGHMASFKQVLANKKNAKKSTGPSSSQGKLAIRKNALKHGILSKVTVLEDEDHKLFGRFKSDMVSHLNPVNPSEELCVDRIISCAWRLRRILQIENFFFQDELSFDRYNPVAKIAENFVSRGNTLALVNRYEVNVERSLSKAIYELNRLKSLNKTDGAATDIDPT